MNITKKTFTLYWEVRGLLSLGVLFLSSGLGILVYKNVEKIGHIAILTTIAFIALACFYYTVKKSSPFSPQKLVSPSLWFDYILFLGAMLSGVFVGYIQFTYAIFGSHYAVAIGIPALFYLALAYRFDHVGVLQLALSGLCAAIGISVVPETLINFKMWETSSIMYSGFILGLGYALIAWLCVNKNFKAHFYFSYLNFALHLCMLTAITRMIMGQQIEAILGFLILTLFSITLMLYARKQKSYYLFLCAIVYGYITLTYVYIRQIVGVGLGSGSGSGYAILLYFMLSCWGVILLFTQIKSLLGIDNARLPKK